MIINSFVSKITKRLILSSIKQFDYGKTSLRKISWVRRIFAIYSYDITTIIISGMDFNYIQGMISRKQFETFTHIMNAIFKYKFESSLLSIFRSIDLPYIFGYSLIFILWILIYLLFTKKIQCFLFVLSFDNHDHSSIYL